MKLLINKSNPKEAIILAFGEDDIKTLHILNDNSLVFGMYLVWFGANGKPLSEQIQPIVTKFPSVEGIAFLNMVNGFVPTVPKEIK